MLSGDARHTQQQSPLIGRDRARETLHHAILRAVQGVPSVVGIRGRGGMGKTRVCAEAASYARLLGVTVVAGRAVAATSTIPFAPLANGVRRALADAPSDASALLALRRVLEGAEANGAEGLPGAVSALRRLVASFGHPLLVILDDLHHADRYSTQLLAALASQLSDEHLCIVASSGFHSPNDELLRSSCAEGALHDIDLPPLDEAAASELVRCTAGTTMPAHAIDAIVGSSSGNPLVLVSLATGVASSGVVPDEISDDVVARLLPNDVGCLELSKALAAAAPVALSSLPALAEAVQLSSALAEDAFDALTEAGLVEASDLGEYTLSPEALRRSVYRALGVTERRRLHRALAAGLDTLRSRGETVDVRLVAHHAASGALGVDADAARWAAAAGDVAAEVSAAQAAAWYERAVELSPLCDASRPGHLARLTDALFRAGDPTHGMVRGREALAVLRPGDERTRTVMTVVEALLAGAHSEQAMVLLEDERDYGELDACLLSLRAAASLAVGDHARAAQDLLRARQELSPSRAGLSEAPLVVQTYSAYLAHARADVEETRVRLREVQALAAGAPQQRQEWALGFGAFMLASTRMPLEAEVLLRKAEQLRVGGGTSSWTELAGVMVQACRGEWEGFLLEGARLHDEFRATGNAIGVGVLGTLLTMSRWAQGQVESPDPPRQRTRSADRVTPGIQNEAWAMHLLLRAARPRAPHLPDPGWVVGLAAPYAALLTGGGPTASSGTAAPSSPCFSQLVTSLAAAEKSFDADAAVTAVDLARSLGLPFYEAQARLAVGMLREGTGDDLTEAWRLFDEIGATRYRQRTAAALRQWGLPVPRKRRAIPGSLTQSEWQVVELISQGLRNRDIAEQLSYSLRTVETYVTRIYEKTGIGSRVDLVRARAAGTLQ